VTSLALDLRRERSRRGLSQERMAAWLGVSVRQYQRWEGGWSAPRGHERERLRALLADSPAGDTALVAELTRLQDELEQARTELAGLRALLRLARIGAAEVGLAQLEQLRAHGGDLVAQRRRRVAGGRRLDDDVEAGAERSRPQAVQPAVGLLAEERDLAPLAHRQPRRARANGASGNAQSTRPRKSRAAGSSSGLTARSRPS
jgi:transcriptional regulator with XRE-family HTH domain